MPPVLEAAGVDDPLAVICPQQFALPAAPTVAARVAGTALDLVAIREAHAALRSDHEFMLVEGAGGLLVPFDSGTTMADLALRLGLPVLLVARASLGTINHTLLSVQAIRSRGLQLVAIVFNRTSNAEADFIEQDNPEIVRSFANCDSILQFPFITGVARPDQSRQAIIAAGHLLLDIISPTPECLQT